MNSNKKSPTVRGVPPSFKPVVAQLKTGTSAQSIKRPVAPPVYRPQTAANAAQPKMANGVVNRKLPVAPPVYRPQVPKVLQRKSLASPTPAARANVASRVGPHGPSKPVVIQRASDESKNLQDLGKMWAQIAEEPKTSKAKKKFFEHADEVKEKTGFKIYTVWHKHDPYVGGGKNKNYKKIVAALQGADAGKAMADKYIEWAEAGAASFLTLPHELQELAMIVHVAEVGRLYGDAPKKLLGFMKLVSGASLAERAELWKNFKEYNEYAFTAKEDGEWLPDSGDEMSDDD